MSRDHKLFLLMLSPEDYPISVTRMALLLNWSQAKVHRAVKKLKEFVRIKGTRLFLRQPYPRVFTKLGKIEILL